MNETMSLSVIDTVNLSQVTQQMQKIGAFQAVVQQTLKKGHDFGVIPGTDKPTLLKPGAEKILMLMGLTSEYEIVEKVQDYDRGFFAFTVKCTVLKNNQKITEGVGHANTREGRYANRWVTEKKLPEGVDKNTLRKREKEGKYGKYTEYQVGNDDSFTLANTVLKMAKKRSQVDAVLTVASLSEIFTQDLEDMIPFVEEQIKQEPIKQQFHQQKPQQQTPPPADNNLATEPQRKRLFAMSKQAGMEPDDLKVLIEQHTGKTSTVELTKDDIKRCFEAVEFIIEANKSKQE
jgi:hypothetical protein